MLMRRLLAARNVPPKPAMAAETPNSMNFGATGEVPAVAAATSDERMAIMARPVGERRRLCTPRASNPKIASSSMA